MIVLIVATIFTACSKEETSLNNNNPGNPNNPNNPGSGRYIHWTRHGITTDDQFSRTARLVKDGKIYASPYSYSTDGINWTTDPNDGLNRSFQNLSGDFWVEISYTSSGTTKTYTALNSGASITLTNPFHGVVAWNGGSKAYTIANNYQLPGGAWDDDYILETTDGVNWEPILNQPPHIGNMGSILKIWLIDGNLHALSMNTTQGTGIIEYKLHISNGNSWISSGSFPKTIEINKVTGHGIFANMDGGTYKLVVNGPSITFQNLEFENPADNSTQISGQTLNANGMLLLATLGRLYVPHPVTDKLFNPSPSEGNNALPGVGGIVVFGNELIVTRGWFVYKTPFPFIYHENP